MTHSARHEVKHREWDIGSVLLIEKRNLKGLVISLHPEALIRVRILEKIVGILAKRGISIILLRTNATRDYFETLIFIDITDTEADINEVIKEILSVKAVKHVELIDPVADGLIANYLHYPPTILGQRAIILRKPLWEAFIRGGYERFGEAHAVFLYHLGRNAGLSDYKAHEGLIGYNPKSLIALAESFFKICGFGSLKVEKIREEPPVAIVRVYNSCECELFLGSKRPSSHFIRGLIAGWFCGFFKRDMSAEEVECIAKGDKSCMFRVYRV